MLKKLSLLASAVVLLVVGLRADNIVDEIIARVNNQIITRSEMEKAKQTNLEELKQRSPLTGRQNGPRRKMTFCATSLTSSFCSRAATSWASPVRRKW